MTIHKNEDYKALYKGSKGELKDYLKDCIEKKVPAIVLGTVPGRKDIFAVKHLNSEGEMFTSKFPIVTAKFLIVALQDIIDKSEFDD